MENIQADSPSTTIHRTTAVGDDALRTKIMEFYSNQAKENPSNTRVIFGTANKLLQGNIEKNTAKNKSISDLAEEFSSFSANKISTIRQCLSSSRQDTVDSQQRILVSSMRKRYERSSAHPYLSSAAWIHYQLLCFEKILTLFYHPQTKS